jgi:rare lipoprotein A
MPSHSRTLLAALVLMVGATGCAAARNTVAMRHVVADSRADSRVDPSADARDDSSADSRDDSRAETGIASYYGRKFHGRRTASGELFDMDSLTAAHRTLAFGTRVRVTNLENQRDVILVITDRGPFRRGRIVDVSRRAARELGFLSAGTAPVRLEILADQ